MSAKASVEQNQALADNIDIKVEGALRYLIINSEQVRLFSEVSMGGSKNAVMGPVAVMGYSPMIQLCSKDKKLWTICSITGAKGEILLKDKMTGVKLEAGTGVEFQKKINDSTRLAAGLNYHYVVLGYSEKSGPYNTLSGHQVTVDVGLRFDIANGKKK